MHPLRSFADVEYDSQPRQTRRDRVPRRMGRAAVLGAAGSACAPRLPHRRARATALFPRPAAADSLRAAALEP